MIFRDEAGKAIHLRGGEQGMMIGIDHIRPGDENLALLAILMMCSEYAIGQYDFGQITFRFPNGEASEKTFTKQELRKTARDKMILIG